MYVLKRKNLVLGMLVLLLVVTGYLNFRYNQNTVSDKSKDMVMDDEGQKPIVTIKDAQGEESNKGDIDDSASSEIRDTSASGGFFVEYRFERENKRKDEIDYIREIVNNPNSDADIKKEAQEQMLEITKSMEKELNVEGLLKAKGFDDSLVIFNQDYISVIVEREELAPEEVAQILDIVKRESGKAAEKIKIFPTYQ